MLVGGGGQRAVGRLTTCSGCAVSHGRQGIQACQLKWGIDSCLQLRNQTSVLQPVVLCRRGNSRAWEPGTCNYQLAPILLD